MYLVIGFKQKRSNITSLGRGRHREDGAEQQREPAVRD